ncbi:MAG: DHH family phosphoesterase, partial [Firmicutes bacterium]|nr:DHH family phosphoesterase [Bacillota bacterium]
MRDYSGIIRLIKASERILVFTHANMDGDALGSAGALCRSLRAMGKKAFLLAEKPCPEYLAFLAEDWLVFEAPYAPDLSIAVDMGQDSRLEGLKDVFYSAPERLCIDHHVRTEDFCEVFA